MSDCIVIQYLPRRDKIPPAAHTIKLSPTDPVSDRTPFGEIKIPDPIEREKKKT